MIYGTLPNINHIASKQSNYELSRKCICFWRLHLLIINSTDDRQSLLQLCIKRSVKIQLLTDIAHSLTGALHVACLMCSPNKTP
jgi:hypothetical protein